MSIVRRTVTRDLAAPAAAVWTSLADTQRFNEAIGAPRQEIARAPDGHGGVRTSISSRLGPFAVRWDAPPSNWLEPLWYDQARLYRNGPLRRTEALITIEPTASGCRARAEFALTPRGRIGALFVRAALAPSVVRAFSLLLNDVERHAQGKSEIAFPIPPPALPAAAKARLATARDRLDDDPLALRLIERVRTAPESDLARMRPLELARLWAAEERRVIELFVEATRAGLLELRWLLLCPRCRGASGSFARLDEAPRGAHCPSCDVDYERDFSRNVEAAFRPSPAIRPLGEGEFCSFGPMNEPHVAGRLTVEPGAARRERYAPPPGRYRIRTFEPGPERDYDHEGGALPKIAIGADAILLEDAPNDGEVVVENATDDMRTLVLERREWADFALTAERATSLQCFRDAFATQALRPGDEVAITRMAFFFSDICGSTALYGEIGDAAAFGLVREHFAAVQKIVRERNGAIVKTIGDEVMASFLAPADALAAAIALQESARAARARDGASALRFKIAVHVGPCIAVTLNDRIDYFGATVNLASRLQSLSEGDDVVVSEALLEDPAAAARAAALASAREEAALEGVAEKTPFRRLRLAETPTGIEGGP